MKKPLSKRRVQVVALRAFQDDEEQRTSSPFHAQQPGREQSVGWQAFCGNKTVDGFLSIPTRWLIRNALMRRHGVSLRQIVVNPLGWNGALAVSVIKL